MNAGYRMSTKTVYSKWRNSSQFSYLQILIIPKKINLNIMLAEQNNSQESQKKNMNSSTRPYINVYLKLKLFLPGIFDRILSCKKQIEMKDTK